VEPSERAGAALWDGRGGTRAGLDEPGSVARLLVIVVLSRGVCAVEHASESVVRRAALSTAPVENAGCVHGTHPQWPRRQGTGRSTSNPPDPHKPGGLHAAYRMISASSGRRAGSGADLSSTPSRAA